MKSTNTLNKAQKNPNHQSGNELIQVDFKNKKVISRQHFSDLELMDAEWNAYLAKRKTLKSRIKRFLMKFF